METSWFGGRARLIACATHDDQRGMLLPFHFDRMPFVPVRSFAVSRVPAGTVRGGHAHRSGMQLLVCLQGCIEIRMCHQDEEATLMLEPSACALLLGPDVWSSQKYLLDASVLLCFASEPYDPGSYVGQAA